MFLNLNIELFIHACCNLFVVQQEILGDSHSQMRGHSGSCWRLAVDERPIVIYIQHVITTRTSTEALTHALFLCPASPRLLWGRQLMMLEIGSGPGDSYLHSATRDLLCLRAAGCTAPTCSAAALQLARWLGQTIWTWRASADARVLFLLRVFLSNKNYHLFHVSFIVCLFIVCFMSVFVICTFVCMLHLFNVWCGVSISTVFLLLPQPGNFPSGIKLKYFLV